MTTAALTRRMLKVRGVVQGVGFRPAVYRLAVEQHLRGFVRNDAGGVTIEIEGDDETVASFDRLLRLRAPAASRIDAIDGCDVVPRGEQEFQVFVSAMAGASPDTRTEVPADRATCDDCLTELFEANDRRFRYPFITCTNCGPRYTIVRELPYDRARTTMSGFEMCAACRAEYEDPLNRRFHSETNSCPACGPRLRGDDAAGRLRAGEIVAIKGLGGFHLAVDATNEVAVARLRGRKKRPHKPFAVMASSLEVAQRFAAVDDVARRALLDPSRPIVCLSKRAELAHSVAPGLNEIGVMLPYTPLHHLLLTDGPDVLVMTSGNRADEPIAIDDDRAFGQLGAIADAFLVHDRPIHRRADDSVIRIVATEPQPVRRSRGVVPEKVMLPFEGPAVLGVGAELKNTICATRGDAAYLSPHIGDLSHPEAFSFFEESIAAMRELVADPVVIAHDLHPDYQSTRWAMRSTLRHSAVQHHHAHIASCLAEHRRTDRVIGVAFDGTGCGPAGELWGGEFLVCDLDSFTRHAHVRALALPGGDAAIREPWRLAIAALVDAGVAPPDSKRARQVRALIGTGTNCPYATSAGRWFDAVAALCGLRETISYEGQAAMELESLATDGESYPFELTADEIDLRPMVRSIVADAAAADVVASRFHATLVRSTAAMCDSLRARTGIGTVALSGGCFQNKRLTEHLKTALEHHGFEVLIHRLVPPNDGGIALGQAAVAGWRLRGLDN